MRRARVIASATLCLLLTGATLAVADQDQGRGDRKGDGDAKSEEKSKEKSREHRTLRGGDRGGQGADRDRRGYDRDRSGDARDRGGYARDRGDARDRGSYDRDRRTVETRRGPREVSERWVPRNRTDARMVWRTPTPSGWYNNALRGHAQYSAWDGYRAERWNSEHRSWRARGGYEGYRLPDRRYQVAFGPSHRFRVDRCPLVVVSGYPRFYYAGYWITFIDPWPEYWDDYWFAEDDCYVIYEDGGYYLTNVRYPRVRVAVSFTLG
jgi:hypothetical protein